MGNFEVIEGGAGHEHAELVAESQHHKQVLVDLPLGAAAVAAGCAVPRAERHADARLLRRLRHAVRVGAVRPRCLPPLLRQVMRTRAARTQPCLYDVLEHVDRSQLHAQT